MGFGEYPAEYNAKVHGPYDPARWYGKGKLSLTNIRSFSYVVFDSSASFVPFLSTSMFLVNFAKELLRFCLLKCLKFLLSCRASFSRFHDVFGTNLFHVCHRVCLVPPSGSARKVVS